MHTYKAQLFVDFDEGYFTIKFKTQAKNAYEETDPVKLRQQLLEAQEENGRLRHKIDLVKYSSNETTQDRGGRSISKKE